LTGKSSANVCTSSSLMSAFFTKLILFKDKAQTETIKWLNFREDRARNKFRPSL
jgi:hypothetical protein